MKRMQNSWKKIYSTASLKYLASYLEKIQKEEWYLALNFKNGLNLSCIVTIFSFLVIISSCINNPANLGVLFVLPLLFIVYIGIISVLVIRSSHRPKKTVKQSA